jgi:thiosulfate dehydrogenase
MKALSSSWLPITLALIIMVIIAGQLLFPSGKDTDASLAQNTFPSESGWAPPDTSSIPATAEGDRIRYGHALIANTAYYLGPKGVVAQISNGMNCQNCHLNAGLKDFSNPFYMVASAYPQYRHRSGRVESVEFRVNDCMERSMHGQKLDSGSEEMRAMVAYLKWVGKDLPKGSKPRGTAVEELPYLERPADPGRGKMIYEQKCMRCHGEGGQGVANPEGWGYTYPPLWGPRSFNTAAGLYRLSRMAGFVKGSMPYDSAALGYKLSNEDAWDVSAYIVSQPRPVKTFAFDWPNIAKKPADHPFGPFADPFPESQHKYGPFGPIKEASKK